MPLSPPPPAPPAPPAPFSCPTSCPSPHLSLFLSASGCLWRQRKEWRGNAGDQNRQRDVSAVHAVDEFGTNGQDAQTINTQTKKEGRPLEFPSLEVTVFQSLGPRHPVLLCQGCALGRATEVLRMFGFGSKPTSGFGGKKALIWASHTWAGHEEWVQAVSNVFFSGPGACRFGGDGSVSGSGICRSACWTLGLVSGGLGALGREWSAPVCTYVDMLCCMHICVHAIYALGREWSAGVCTYVYILFTGVFVLFIFVYTMVCTYVYTYCVQRN